jgi:hypothetical protein
MGAILTQVIERAQAFRGLVLDAGSAKALRLAIELAARELASPAFGLVAMVYIVAWVVTRVCR